MLRVFVREFCALVQRRRAMCFDAVVHSQARELKEALAKVGIVLHIIDVSAGQNITGKLMGKGRARVVFGGRLVRRNRGSRSGGSDFEVAHN